MAAEALYNFDANPKYEIDQNGLNLKIEPNLKPGDIFKQPENSNNLLENFLTIGNRHASHFTNQDAAEFTENWMVLEHKSNTATGFSGTLFQNKDTKEVVISFRSTEFLDDSARDNQATNALEIKAFGWAFGQIADMNKWWEELKEKYEPALKNGVSVTGYSFH